MSSFTLVDVRCVVNKKNCPAAKKSFHFLQSLRAEYLLLLAAPTLTPYQEDRLELIESTISSIR